MRIISGKYKGRTLDGFNIDGTRPTMDRVKESMIATIQNKIPNSVSLDLFAGSGSVGLEIISNGGKKCFFIDSNKKAIDILRNNIKKINITEECILVNSDYKKFLNTTNEKFDIIFLDPPYKMNLINDSLELIYKNNLLNNNGIVICEYENENVESNYFELIKEKKYSSKYIKIYKK